MKFDQVEDWVAFVKTAVIDSDYVRLWEFEDTVEEWNTVTAILAKYPDPAPSPNDETTIRVGLSRFVLDFDDTFITLKLIKETNAVIEKRKFEDIRDWWLAGIEDMGIKPKRVSQ